MPTDKIPRIAEVIRERRKKLSLTLEQLAKMSGVSLAHLGRVEQGQRGLSSKTLQRIAKPLDFDVHELLVTAGHLKPGPFASLSEKDTASLRAELDVLTDRVIKDTNRIHEIVERLLL